ncbi:MAG: hypothetical protein ACK566_00455 [Bacteroidota bacterium]
MKFSKVIILGLLLVVLSNCRNPLDDFSELQLGFDAGVLLNPAINLSFGIMDETGVVPENVTVSIEGDAASLITDANGEYFYNVNQDGSLPLMLKPEANPTEADPILVKIIAEAKDCMPIEEEIYITSRTNNPFVKLSFYRNTNLPAGCKMQQYPAMFRGKKATDTLVFEHQNLSGVNFTFRYPVKGAKFVVRNTINVIQSIREQTVTDDSWDTTWKELVEYEEDSIVGSDYFYEGQPIGGKNIKVKRIREEIKGKRRLPVVVKTLVDTLYTQKVIPDTIPVENVTASIYSNTRIELETSGFYDEQCNYINKPRLFNGVIRVPDVRFTTAAGQSVEVFYPEGIKGGRIIEMDITDKSLSLYQAGMTSIYNKNLNEFEYAYVPIIIPYSKLPFENGKLIFRDNYMFNSYFFLFKDYTLGCGFSKIVINPEYDLETFWAYWQVDHGILSYWTLYPTWYTSTYGTWKGYDVPQVSMKLPAFNEFGKAKVKFVVDHEYNRCLGKPILYQKVDEYDPCAVSEYVYSVNYDPGVFWAQYINYFCKVFVDAKITCKSGSLIELPKQRVYYYKIGCDPNVKTETELDKGKTQLRLINQSSYIISVINPYNGGSIKDTLVLNEKDQFLEGFLTNKAGVPQFRAFSGNLKYDKVMRTYSLDLVFENYFKFTIPGCGS